MNPAPRQHTPGPWSFRPQNYPKSRHVSHYEIQSGNDMVATGAAHLFAAEANARLIASAPDLLAALEAAAELAEGTVKLLRQLDMESGRIAAECVLRDARAAIARAVTGGNAS